jgi:hypothetical protein
MRTASAAQPRALPKSLMRRLDLLQVGLLPVAKAREPRAGAPPPLRKAAKARVGAFFALGLVGGSAVGGAALLGLVLDRPDVRGSHETAALSDVAAPPAAREGSRPASEPPALTTSAPAVETPFTTDVLAEPPPALPPAEVAADAAKAWSTDVRAAAAEKAGDAPIAPQQAYRDAAPVQRPDGISALGGPTSGEPAAAPIGRQVWWKLPAPRWTPFDDRLGPN